MASYFSHNSFTAILMYEDFRMASVNHVCCVTPSHAAGSCFNSVRPNAELVLQQQGTALQ